MNLLDLPIRTRRSLESLFKTTKNCAGRFWAGALWLIGLSDAGSLQPYFINRLTLPQ